MAEFVNQPLKRCKCPKGCASMAVTDGFTTKDDVACKTNTYYCNICKECMGTDYFPIGAATPPISLPTPGPTRPTRDLSEAEADYLLGWSQIQPTIQRPSTHMSIQRPSLWSQVETSERHKAIDVIIAEAEKSEPEPVKPRYLPLFFWLLYKAIRKLFK